MIEKKVLRLYDKGNRVRYCLENCRTYGEEAFLLELCEPHPFQYEIQTRYLEDYYMKCNEDAELAFYYVWDFDRKRDDCGTYKTHFNLLWEEH